LAKT
jgi:hypothetical protein